VDPVLMSLGFGGRFVYLHDQTILKMLQNFSNQLTFGLNEDLYPKVWHKHVSNI
jgi:hypothetical protein